MHWFIPKNQGFYFVPVEKPANFYFKIKTKTKSSLTMKYLNTMTMKRERMELVLDPLRAT